MNLCGYNAGTTSDTVIRSVFAQPQFYGTQWFKLIAIVPYRSFFNPVHILLPISSGQAS
jgi:hypothetical protein